MLNLLNMAQVVPNSPGRLKLNRLQAHKCSIDLSSWKETTGVAADVYHVPSPSIHSSPSSDSPTPQHDFISLLTYHDSFFSRSYHSISFVATPTNEDILTQSQMLKATDSQEFINCLKAEIDGLRKFDVMDIHHTSTLPAKAKLLSSIWSYRRKRLPNGVLLKHKSHICVNGKEQAFGRDYWETYAPVASWAMIRLMLILSTLLNLKTRQVDYTQAFPQAILEDPVFMRVPQGWYVDSKGQLQQHADPRHNDSSHYLRLKRNLYGCKQAARNWFHHLTTGLLKLGFTQSKTDSCLFL
jgi:hypothetical protein